MSWLTTLVTASAIRRRLSRSTLLSLVGNLLSTPCSSAVDPFDRALVLRREQSVPTVVAALEDTSEIVPIVAARRLATLGPEVGSFAPQLLRAFDRSREVEVRCMLAAALGRFALPSDAIVKAMSVALADTSALVRGGAAYSLTRLGRVGLQTLVDSAAIGSLDAQESSHRALGEWLYTASPDDRRLLERIDTRALVDRLASFPSIANGGHRQRMVLHHLWALVESLEIPTTSLLPLLDGHLNEPSLASIVSLHRILATRLPETRRQLERAWLETNDQARSYGLQVIGDPAVDRESIRSLVEQAVRLTPALAARDLRHYGDSEVPLLASFLFHADSSADLQVVEQLAKTPSGRDTLRARMPEVMTSVSKPAWRYDRVWKAVDPEARDRWILDRFHPSNRGDGIHGYLTINGAATPELVAECLAQCGDSWTWHSQFRMLGQSGEAARDSVAVLIREVERAKREDYDASPLSPSSAALAALSELGPAASEAGPSLERAIEGRRGEPGMVRTHEFRTYLTTLIRVDPDRATPILTALFREGGFAADAAARAIPIPFDSWQGVSAVPHWEWERQSELRLGVLSATQSGDAATREHAARLLRRATLDAELLAKIWHVAVRHPDSNWRELLPREIPSVLRGDELAAPALLTALGERGEARSRAVEIICTSGLRIAGAGPALESLVSSERLPGEDPAWLALDVVDPP